MPPKNLVTASVLPPLALALWLACGWGGAHAADDDKRLAQARDAMRRAQQQLQQTQAERATLQREKAALEQERERLSQLLAQAEARQRSSSAQQAALGSNLAGAQAERERLSAELAKERGTRSEGERQLETQQTRLLATQQSLEEQKRLTTAVSALFERSVKSLAETETKNRELHALAMQAVDAYLMDTPVAMRANDEPFLGLGKVALESRAEELRREMAAQKVGR